MPKIYQSPTHRRVHHQGWYDEIAQSATPLAATSILYVIVEAHKAVKRVAFTNTPRQHKRRTKHNNRFKTHLEISFYAFRIGNHDSGY